ncbi:MAG: hypothetical protein DWQ34_25915 [Planctomycetota bacterium]|nr:MAG: hypothetical protein DWQ34_25915 [Planctomycetota bacterium]REK25849.1 MAG: hypothetical protein DWQ41_11050 [Planctomycetota bacterium]REK37128.1 MAG: hypothetical protein DWQ45_07860 [Planctomycetota bacterium]
MNEVYLPPGVSNAPGNEIGGGNSMLAARVQRAADRRSVQRRRNGPAPDPSQVGPVRAAQRARGRSVRIGTPSPLPGCEVLPVQGKWSVQRNKAKAVAFSRRVAWKCWAKRDRTECANEWNRIGADCAPRGLDQSCQLSVFREAE